MKKMMKGLILEIVLLSTAGAQFVQQGSKIVLGATPYGNLAAPVALSGDGNTAVIAGSSDYEIWIFKRAGGAWVVQDHKFLGRVIASLSISADGNTILAGGPGANGGAGTAWVFVRHDQAWTQTDALVGNGADPIARQGWSVALAADGNTAIVGGPYDDNTSGSAFVYTRNGGIWTQQGPKLVGSGAVGRAFQGKSVALSGDGNTALIGGHVDNNGVGAVWVFTRNNGIWSQQGDKLVGSGGNGWPEQGASVALSADGNTALVGGPSDVPSGAVWVFARSGGIWAQQGNKLTGSGIAPGNSSAQGFSVSLSADGNVALAGAPGDGPGGAAWVFRRSGRAWTQFGNKLIVTGSANAEGYSAALSAGGSTAILGGLSDGRSSAWVFTVPQRRDFNADAQSDALMYDPGTGTAFTALSNGDGSFQYVYNLFSPGFDLPRTGDFNGDGRKDLVLYNSQTGLGYIGMSKGDGKFNFQSLFLPVGLTSIETGDLNGDGKTDLVLHKDGTSLMYAGIGNGDGTFTYKSTFVSNNGRTFIRVGDFTGDGKADVFLYSPGNGSAHLAIGDGNGSFLLYFVFLSQGYSDLQVGDLNGDGKADIVVYNSIFGNAATGISDGLGGFSLRPLLFTPGFTSVRLADFTGDGKDDLTLYNSRTGLGYFGTGAGDGTFAFQSLFWSPGYDQVVAQDLNGDFKTDILLYNALTGTAYAGISNGDGTFTYTYSLWRRGQKIVDQ